MKSFMQERGLENWYGSLAKTTSNFEMNSGIKFPGQQLSFYSDMKISDFQKSKLKINKSEALVVETGHIFQFDKSKYLCGKCSFC